MKTINIGLIGLGTVGMGVYQIIEEHQEELNYKTGYKISINHVLVRDLGKKRDGRLNEHLLTDDIEDLINDPNTHVIIEVAGGIATAKHFLDRALRAGKHCITANKDLMALHGSELLSLAKENNCDFFYEASVGGGIPIIRSLEDGLSSDKITQLTGIINGTTNYILTKMDHDGLSYGDALRQAQELGFAEADPTSDVGGFDAGRKMAILANLAFSMPIDLEDVRIKGIDGLKAVDIAYGKQLGYEMKLLGIAKLINGAAAISVEPTFIPHTHPLTSVHNEYNAVCVEGEAVGTTMFYGPGAGSLPTATAIVSDVVTVIRNMALGVTGRHILAPRKEKAIAPETEDYAKYYIRLEVLDEVGVLSKITSLFAAEGVSFEKIHQEPYEGDHAQIIMITHQIHLKALKGIKAAMEATSKVLAIDSIYRIEA